MCHPEIIQCIILSPPQDCPRIFFAQLAAAKFALSRNAFRKILQFLLRNSKSGFQRKITLYSVFFFSNQGLKNLKLSLDSSAVTAQS